MMKPNTISLLLVARPGRMREGLQALLRTIPEIEIAGQVVSKAQAMEWIVQQPPALVLLDSSLTLQEMLLALLQIKGGYPLTRCIVLVKNAQQQGAAKEAGADIVLITGFSADELHSAIHLVSKSIKDHTESQKEIQDG